MSSNRLFVPRSNFNNSTPSVSNVASTTEIKIVPFDPVALIPVGVKPVWVEVCDFGAHGVTLKAIFGDELQTKWECGTSTVHADRAAAQAWIKMLALPKIVADPTDRFTANYGQMQKSSIGRDYVVTGFGVRPTAIAVAVSFVGMEAF